MLHNDTDLICVLYVTSLSKLIKAERYSIKNTLLGLLELDRSTERSTGVVLKIVRA